MEVWKMGEGYEKTGILEEKEWSNLWWEEAYNHEKKRILLVGDSITNGYQPAVNGIFKGEILANAWTTSKALDNPYFLEELDFVWRQNGYRYELIHFNNGLHGWHLGEEEYEKLYERVIEYIMKMHPDTKIVLALSTPVCIPGPQMELDPEKNQQVLKRNEIVKKIGKKYRLSINDLYTAMLGEKEFRSEDGYHYNQKGIAYQGKIVSDFIRLQFK